MAESKAQEQQKSGREFAVTRVYTKDISFETPNSPELFLVEDKWQPEVDVALGNRAVTVRENLHEVTLSVTVTAKLGTRTAYLAEVHQGGLFYTPGYQQPELAELLGSYCPNLLFPFAREVIANLITKGGFPPLLLAPVNFEALYNQHLKQVQQQQQEQQGQAPLEH